jgi:subtilisin family serine protease
MRPLPLPTFLLAAALAACSPAAPAPSVAPTPVARATPAVPPSPGTDTARADWQHLDATLDGVQGTGARRAEQELLKGRKPARTVVVAIIDGGVDTAHADLRANLWTNPREPVNGRDDDGDGLVDDSWGWNYLGGADGRNVNEETLELTREYARCKRGETASADCGRITEEFTRKRAEAEQQAAQYGQMATVYGRVVEILGRAAPGAPLTAERVRAIVPANDTVAAAQDLYLRLAEAGVDGAELEEAAKSAATRLEYGYNPEFNPRTIIGDDPRDGTQRTYGNRDVTGPDAGHGSHVAGIVGAVRGDGLGIEGIAASVRLMAVRAVPDGDERDKDVAMAIRYATDHGAQIINMSFGKGFSPEKPLVDEAVKYAESKGVLLVHAAGNDGADLAVEPNFPLPVYADGSRAANWIEVGASSWEGGEELAAEFSNWGKDQVDLFAPGVDILSTIPGGGWERNSGTSMAAPVVSGVAALLMSYFPSLTAADVKRILLETATRYPDVMVLKPGSSTGEKIRFGELSRTGGVVNAYEAVKAALAREGATP